MANDRKALDCLFGFGFGFCSKIEKRKKHLFLSILVQWLDHNCKWLFFFSNRNNNANWTFVDKTIAILIENDIHRINKIENVIDKCLFPIDGGNMVRLPQTRIYRHVYILCSVHIQCEAIIYLISFQGKRRAIWVATIRTKWTNERDNARSSLRYTFIGQI